MQFSAVSHYFLTLAFEYFLRDSEVILLQVIIYFLVERQFKIRTPDLPLQKPDLRSVGLWGLFVTHVVGGVEKMAVEMFTLNTLNTP